VRCGRCGAAMTGAMVHSKQRVYRCTAFDPYNVGDRKVCRPSPWTDADRLEALVWQAVCDIVRDPDVLRNEFERRLQEAGAVDALNVRAHDLRRELDRIKRQQNRLLDIYQAEEMDKDELQRRLAVLHRQREEAERELAQVAARQEEQVRLADAESAFRDFLNAIAAGLDALDFTGRQQTLRLLLRGVIVDVDAGAVKIQTILPLPKAHSGLGSQPASPNVQLRRMGGHPRVQHHTHFPSLGGFHQDCPGRHRTCWHW